MGTMCKRSNYTPNSPQYEGDCEYRITSNVIKRQIEAVRVEYRKKKEDLAARTGAGPNCRGTPTTER